MRNFENNQEGKVKTMYRERGERRERGRGFNRGRGRQFPPKPVEIGREYDVEVQETSRRGEGIARIKGLVIFIPNANPGDRPRIKIIRISRRFAEAEIVSKTLEPEGETEEESEK